MQEPFIMSKLATENQAVCKSFLLQNRFYENQEAKKGKHQQT